MQSEGTDQCLSAAHARKAADGDMMPSRKNNDRGINPRITEVIKLGFMQADTIFLPIFNALYFKVDI